MIGEIIVTVVTTAVTDDGTVYPVTALMRYEYEMDSIQQVAKKVRKVLEDNHPLEGGQLFNK